MENSLTIVTNDLPRLVHEHQKGVTSLEIRRAIANSEILDKLNTIDRSVFLASTGKVAREFQELELTRELAELLKWIAKDVGIREMGADMKITIVRIAQIVKKYYEWFSMDDIRMAFELAVTGELNEFLPKDKNGNPDKEHYQMFNVDYFCKIMNAYKKYRSAVIDKATELVPRPQYQRNKQRDEFVKREVKKQTIEVFLYYKYHGRMQPLTPIGERLIYTDLASVGLADEIITTEAEEEAAMRRVITSLMHKRRFGAVKEIEERKGKVLEVQYQAMVAARMRMIRNIFDEIVSDELQITDYIQIP